MPQDHTFLENGKRARRARAHERHVLHGAPSIRIVLALKKVVRWGRIFSILADAAQRHCCVVRSVPRVSTTRIQLSPIAIGLADGNFDILIW